MKRSKFLSLSALYLVSHTALAIEPSQPSQRAESNTASTEEVISAIRTEVVAASKLADEFSSLAGSHQNAEKIVVGLRNAKPVTITATARAATQREVSFTPPTRPLSFPDVHKALSLAQAQLQAKHIDNPTPAQLGASLAGGELPNAQGDITHVIGILPLHRRGMSWDQIARALHIAPLRRVAAVQSGRPDQADQVETREN